jgi:hypothetical protein
MLVPFDWDKLKAHYLELCGLLGLDPRDEESLKSLLSASVIVNGSGNLPALKLTPALACFPQPTLIRFTTKSPTILLIRRIAGRFEQA